MASETGELSRTILTTGTFIINAFFEMPRLWDTEYVNKFARILSFVSNSIGIVQHTNSANLSIKSSGVGLVINTTSAETRRSDASVRLVAALVVFCCTAKLQQSYIGVVEVAVMPTCWNHHSSCL